jgi:hypothetical protein
MLIYVIQIKSYMIYRNHSDARITNYYFFENANVGDLFSNAMN